MKHALVFEGRVLVEREVPETRYEVRDGTVVAISQYGTHDLNADRRFPRTPEGLRDLVIDLRSRGYEIDGYPPVSRPEPRIATIPRRAYAQALGLPFLASPHGSEEESVIERALCMVCERLGIDVDDLLFDLRDDAQVDEFTVERASHPHEVSNLDTSREGGRS